MSSENIIGLRRFPALNHRHSGQTLKTRYVYFESRGRILKWVFLKIKKPDFKKNGKRLLSPIIDDLPWSVERER